MPEKGVIWKGRDQVLTLEEILRLTSVFVRLGIDKVRLTGGEPTVRKGLTGLISKLRSIDGLKTLLMTTNGSTLPDKALEYREAGLDGLNVSIDSLNHDKFQKITRGAKLDKIVGGLEQALMSGYRTIKVNVVVMPGVNDDELCDFVEFGRRLGVHVRFIEFMPFMGNEWTTDGVFSYRQMLDNVGKKFSLTPISVDKSAVAKEFWVDGGPSTIGFVTSVTDDFCEGCNRVRLTADGKLKTCLFLKAGTSLMDMCRQGAPDDDLAIAIHSGLSTKWVGHPDMQRWASFDDRAMVQIGG